MGEAFLMFCCRGSYWLSAYIDGSWFSGQPVAAPTAGTVLGSGNGGRALLTLLLFCFLCVFNKLSGLAAQHPAEPFKVIP